MKNLKVSIIFSRVISSKADSEISFKTLIFFDQTAVN
jgi:hypothetical protein